MQDSRDRTDRIRKYTLSDIDTLWNIYQDCLPPCHFWQFQEAVKSGETYVYEWVSPYNGRVSIKAFVISFIDEKEPWIWAVCTTPYFRGRGIASLLIDEIEQFYRDKYDRINLYVSVDNPAQKLYFDLGYRIVGVEKDIYESAHRNALHMVKLLK